MLSYVFCFPDVMASLNIFQLNIGGYQHFHWDVLGRALRHEIVLLQETHVPVPEDDFLTYHVFQTPPLTNGVGIRCSGGSAVLVSRFLPFAPSRHHFANQSRDICWVLLEPTLPNLPRVLLASVYFFPMSSPTRCNVDAPADLVADLESYR
jgi:hypothetical protein